MPLRLILYHSYLYRQARWSNGHLMIAHCLQFSSNAHTPFPFHLSPNTRGSQIWSKRGIHSVSLIPCVWSFTVMVDNWTPCFLYWWPKLRMMSGEPGGMVGARNRRVHPPSPHTKERSCRLVTDYLVVLMFLCSASLFTTLQLLFFHISFPPPPLSLSLDLSI